MKKRIVGIAAVVVLMAVPATSASAWWGSCTIDGAGRPICHQN